MGKQLLENTKPATKSTDRPITFYTPPLAGGGVGTTTLNLAKEFSNRGYRVHLVSERIDDPVKALVPEPIRIIELKRHSKILARLRLLLAEPGHGFALLRPILRARKPAMTLRQLPALTRYLKEERPSYLISATYYQNFLAILATLIARLDTKIIVTAHISISQHFAYRNKRAGERNRSHEIRYLVRRLYPLAHSVIAVSKGVADDLAVTTGLDRQRIETIYNPIVSPKLHNQEAEAVDHPWFEDDAPPVILGVGRLHPQKNFSLLLEAFAPRSQS